MCASLHSNTVAIHTFSSCLLCIKDTTVDLPVPGCVGRLVCFFGSWTCCKELFGSWAQRTWLPFPASQYWHSWAEQLKLASCFNHFISQWVVEDILFFRPISCTQTPTQVCFKTLGRERRCGGSWKKPSLSIIVPLYALYWNQIAKSRGWVHFSAPKAGHAWGAVWGWELWSD